MRIVRILMSKFIFNNILIEKSERDIQTGKSYEFNSGFNLICGNNEAGKSSIMNFLKESFFLEKGTEIGKIFFQIDFQTYNHSVEYFI